MQESHMLRDSLYLIADHIQTENVWQNLQINRFCKFLAFRIEKALYRPIIV